MKQLAKALLYLLVCSFHSNLVSQDLNTLRNRIDSLITCSNPRPFNGTVLIQEKNKTLYQQVHGFSKYSTQAPLNISQSFEIMSLSKQITAVLILLECEKGVLDLNSNIKKYLPNFKAPWADSVTLHQLLNHTNGIIDFEKPLLFKPGTQFKYGNLNYVLLGQVLEASTHQSYSQLTHQLFKKLNMNQSSCFSEKHLSNSATGHLNTDNRFKQLDSVAIDSQIFAACGVVSTCFDLAIWNQSLHTGKILKKSSYKQMISYSPLNQHDAFGEEKIGYGYGIRIQDLSSPIFYGHTGLGNGYTSFSLYFPEYKISLIVLENQMNDDSSINYSMEIEIRKYLIDYLNSMK